MGIDLGSIVRLQVMTNIENPLISTLMIEAACLRNNLQEAKDSAFPVKKLARSFCHVQPRRAWNIDFLCSMGTYFKGLGF
jgi:hypothetical protein